jgi:hypothetical protein
VRDMRAAVFLVRMLCIALHRFAWNFRESLKVLGNSAQQADIETPGKILR